MLVWMHSPLKRFLYQPLSSIPFLCISGELKLEMSKAAQGRCHICAQSQWFLGSCMDVGINHFIVFRDQQWIICLIKNRSLECASFQDNAEGCYWNTCMILCVSSPNITNGRAVYRVFNTASMGLAHMIIYAFVYLEIIRNKAKL